MAPGLAAPVDDLIFFLLKEFCPLVLKKCVRANTCASEFLEEVYEMFASDDSVPFTCFVIAIIVWSLLFPEGLVFMFIEQQDTLNVDMRCLLDVFPK